MKLILLDSSSLDLLRKNIILHVSLLFVKVLVCFLMLCPKACLMCNFLQKNDRMVKPILLALFSCLASVVIFLDFFQLSLHAFSEFTCIG